MKSVILLIGAALCLCGCTNSAAIKADKALKDSIAMADGNKVLGNITFGISKEEFEKQKEAFLEIQNDTIYNVWVPSIEGKFTPDDRLHTVLFVGMYTDAETDYNDFADFVYAKYGRPTFAKNTWIIGGRRIELKLYRTVNLHAEMRKTYLRMKQDPMYDPSKEKPKYTHNYHSLIISNDSLVNMSHMQDQQLRLQQHRLDSIETLKRNEQMEKGLDKL